MAIKTGIKNHARSLVQATLLETIANAAVKDSKTALKATTLKSDLMLDSEADVIEELEALAELGGVNVEFDTENEEEPYDEIEVTGFKFEVRVTHKKQRTLQLDAETTTPDADEFLINGVQHRLEVLSDKAGKEFAVKIVADDGTGGTMAYEQEGFDIKAVAWAYAQGWRFAQVYGAFLDWLDQMAQTVGAGSELRVDEDTFDLIELFCKDVRELTVSIDGEWKLVPAQLTKDAATDGYEYRIEGDEKKLVAIAWTEAGARWPELGAAAKAVKA